MKKVILVILSLALLLPSLTFGNGGDQRVVDGEYIINLARSPFTPHAGEKVSMLVSFVDIQKDKLIAEDLILKVRIAKWGGNEKRTFIHEQANLKVQGGVIQIPYTFAEAGLHEIFFDFAFASSPQTIYKAPDFLIDVQPIVKEELNWPIIAGLAIGLISCLFMGLFMKQIKK